MRITNLRAVQPAAPQAPPDWRTHMGQILVAVETDQGLSGYGVGGGGAAGIHVIHTVLNEAMVGADPTDPESLWPRMYRATMPFGRKGLAIMALSGVDLALWDLRARRAGQPVARMIHDKPRIDPIPIYQTVFVKDGQELTDRLPSNVEAVKLHFSGKVGDRVSEVVEAVRLTREALGSDRGIMIDAFMRWSVPMTLDVAERVATYNVDWIEEPLPPDDLTGYRSLAERCMVPIAGGEHEFTAQAFERLMDERLLQVLQPDATWCGGMTELIKIYRMADERGLRVCPHRGAEPWALHAMAALDPNPLAETARPWLNWVQGMAVPCGGRVALPTGPGFGVHYHGEHFNSAT